jgi:hypothetical protein
VRFYSGDPDAGGTQISSTQSVTIFAGSFSNVSVLWTVPIGTTRLFVVVDHPTLTNGSINETNETNNKASINMTVDSWNFFYGNLDTGSEFVLEDSAYYKINIWDQSNSTNANIYVADSDSNVAWTNLGAIGKNSSGANATNNDFEEIDVALNSTQFRDSVNKTYTTANHTNETINFTIFQYIVANVPVATSINSSSFKTGILWDRSDNVGEYDSTDKEDLVFVTRVNQDTIGSYGVADYELRVPALLRNYKTTDTLSAAFYIELI